MSRRRLCLVLALFLIALPFATSGRAQSDDEATPQKHGRKYKPPPDTSHIEVTVLKGFNKKPIDSAHVIFHPVKDGKDEGFLEIKTHQDGKASIDVIPTGSKVLVQVIADGFATYAQEYAITDAKQEIVISMIRPQAQVSAYEDNSGKPSQRQPGIQEPIRPGPTSSTGTSSGTAGASGTAGDSGSSGTSAAPAQKPQS